MSEEDESPQEEEFVMEPRRKGKEPMETSSCRSSRGHEAPYIMQSMPVQPKIIKRDRGLAHEVCPNHPEHLEITFHWDQRIESICPKLHPTQVPHGFTPWLAKNYYNKFVAVKKEQTYDPFMYKKMIGIDARFWNDFHMDFYSSIILHKPNKPPIVQMRYVDWEFYENENNDTFRKIIKKCKEFGLYELLGFKYHWNMEIIGQFHSSYYFGASCNSIYSLDDRGGALLCGLYDLL